MSEMKWAITVSYTHLDVYKRQLDNYFDFATTKNIQLNIDYGKERPRAYFEAVSYTHLDVYTRQSHSGCFGCVDWQIRLSVGGIEGLYAGSGGARCV